MAVRARQCQPLYNVCVLPSTEMLQIDTWSQLSVMSRIVGVTAPLPWLPARVNGGDAGSPVMLPLRLPVLLIAGCVLCGTRGGRAPVAVLLVSLLPSASCPAPAALWPLTRGTLGTRPSDALQQGIDSDSDNGNIRREPGNADDTSAGYDRWQCTMCGRIIMNTAGNHDHRRQSCRCFSFATKNIL